jgi:putative heme-binding domain-containing protein
VPKVLLAGWKEHTPALRAAILDALVSRPAWAAALVSSVESGDVAAAEIDPAHRRILLGQRDGTTRKRAEALFSGATSARKDVVDRYRKALETEGDAAAGAAVFRRVCTVCHRLGGEGTEVGADLAALNDKSPESLLIAILDPNRAFETKYTNFIIQTVDGRVLSGMIGAETANSVTLRRHEGKEDAILRTDIEAMSSSGQSMMPEGLEKDLAPRDVANLIAYLRSTGPPRKVIEGNEPAEIRPGPEGRILLRAAAAEIYGDTLVFESMYGNLGYWSSPNDRAAWQLESMRAGRYEVWFDYACADSAQGNRYQLDLAGQRLEGTIDGTGTWDDYHRAKIGEVELSPGHHRLEIRPQDSIHGAMIDLRSVELRPQK